jgi:hypothetical protein
MKRLEQALLSASYLKKQKKDTKQPSSDTVFSVARGIANVL